MQSCTLHSRANRPSPPRSRFAWGARPAARDRTPLSGIEAGIATLRASSSPYEKRNARHEPRDRRSNRGRRYPVARRDARTETEVMTAVTRTKAWDRSAAVERLRDETFDVLVVGGGITGAGVARDAALRGLTVAVVDAGDWAAGTSSRTTKLAHGGLRYLEQMDFGLVRTALAERAVLLAIAPHLTRAAPFLLPVYAGRSRPSWELRTGLWLYDALAGARRLGRHRVLGAEATLEREPQLSPRGLRGAGLYWDARVLDARLVIETVADARRAGAVAANYCSVEDLERGHDGWGAEVHDRRSGEAFTLRARSCVVAVGP